MAYPNTTLATFLGFPVQETQGVSVIWISWSRGRCDFYSEEMNVVEEELV
jgi:hypothetical protein